VYFQDTSKQYQPLFTTKQSSQDCHQYKKNNLWYLWYLCDKFKKRLFDIVASELGCRTILCKRRLADGDIYKPYAIINEHTFAAAVSKFFEK
jgi:hypothetical protein